MKRMLLALALVALALPLSALGGGWATVQLSSLPAGTDAGGTWSPELTILQHGVTPLEGVFPTIRIYDGDGTPREFSAEPTGTPGHYRADVVFPSSGEWRWEVWDGFSQTHTYKPVTIGGGGGESTLPTGPVAGGVLAALGLAAVAVLLLRRRRPAPQPALDA
jgi:hypothetical protein